MTTQIEQRDGYRDFHEWHLWLVAMQNIFGFFKFYILMFIFPLSLSWKVVLDIVNNLSTLIWNEKCPFEVLSVELLPVNFQKYKGYFFLFPVSVPSCSRIVVSCWDDTYLNLFYGYVVQFLARGFSCKVLRGNVWIFQDISVLLIHITRSQVL